MKHALNDRRLTRSQVQEIIAAEDGVLHIDYSKNSISNGLDLVYELSGDRFLYVFNPSGTTLPGKGDIYSGEYFRRFMNWGHRVESDFANGRASSVEHWRFYSQYKNELINHVDALLDNLANELEVEPHLLDKKYISLDLVSHKLEHYGQENACLNLYDNLVAYVGEIIRLRVGGSWIINATPSGGSYPFIEALGVQYMPINAVWSAIHGIDKINLRRETTKIVRQNGWLLKLAKDTSK